MPLNLISDQALRDILLSWIATLPAAAIFAWIAAMALA